MGVGRCGPDRYFFFFLPCFPAFLCLQVFGVSGAALVSYLLCCLASTPIGLIYYDSSHLATERRCRWEVGVDGGKQWKGVDKGEFVHYIRSNGRDISEALLVVVYTYIHL